MKKILAVLLIILSLNIKVYAFDNGQYKSAILVEINSGKVLYEYNEDQVLPQASITKLMTYFVIRDFMESQGIKWDDKIKIDIANYYLEKDAVRVGLRNGEFVTLKDLLYTMIIYSANDSALQLENYYNQVNRGKDFLQEMNKKARELGMRDTVYVNSTGLTETNGHNLTSAKDTEILASELIKRYPDLLEITKNQSVIFKNSVFINWNPLLGNNSKVDGLKTGYTEEAGYCIVATEDLSSSNGNNKPFRLLAVVLGTPTKEARNNESRRILGYGEENFENKICVANTTIFKYENEYYEGGFIDGEVKTDIYLMADKSDVITKLPVFNEKLPRKIKKGDEVGTLTITNETTKEILLEKLYASKDYKQLPFFKKLFLFVKHMFQ